MQTTLRRVAAELLQLAGQAKSQPPAAAAGEAKTHVLIDWENVQPSEADCRALVPGATDVWLFHGPNQKNVIQGYPSFGDRATEIRIARSGKNALDFHLSFYVGYLASQSPGARLVVLSNDKGYGSMLEHAEALGFATRQIGVKRVAKARAPAKKAVARKAARLVLAPAHERAATRPPPVGRAAAKAPAAKKAVVATKKTAPARQAAPPRQASPAKTAKPATGKSLEQLVELLKKSPPANRPRKRSRLLAFFASRIGDDVDAAEAMLSRLAADGRVAIDAKGTVGYRL